MASPDTFIVLGVPTALPLMPGAGLHDCPGLADTLAPRLCGQPAEGLVVQGAGGRNRRPLTCDGPTEWPRAFASRPSLAALASVTVKPCYGIVLPQEALSRPSGQRVASARAAPLRSAETWSGPQEHVVPRGPSRSARGEGEEQPGLWPQGWASLNRWHPRPPRPRPAPVRSEGYRAGLPSPRTVPEVGVASGSQGSDFRRLLTGPAGATDNMCPTDGPWPGGPVTMALGTGTCAPGGPRWAACHWRSRPGVLATGGFDAGGPSTMGGDSAVPPSGGSSVRWPSSPGRAATHSLVLTAAAVHGAVFVDGFDPLKAFPACFPRASPGEVWVRGPSHKGACL